MSIENPIPPTFLLIEIDLSEIETLIYHLMDLFISFQKIFSIVLCNGNSGYGSQFRNRMCNCLFSLAKMAFHMK